MKDPLDDPVILACCLHMSGCKSRKQYEKQLRRRGLAKERASAREEFQRVFPGLPSHLNESYKDGWVIYFARTDQHCKIGTTKLGPDRIATLQTGCPEKITVQYWFWGNHKDEAALHRHFKSQHERGEWFRINHEAPMDCLVLRYLVLVGRHLNATDSIRDEASFKSCSVTIRLDDPHV